MQAHRVLLAHRDPSVHELATRALTRIGVTLDIAADPSEALARIAAEPYTVIVLERDDAVLSALAATRNRPRPSVIVTTNDGHSLDPDVVGLVVPEPYDAHTLIGVILACVTPEVPPAIPSPSPLPAERGEGQGEGH